MGDSQWVREYDETLGTFVTRSLDAPADAFAEYFDEDSQAWYYYNLQTGETSWTIPGNCVDDHTGQESNAAEDERFPQGNDQDQDLHYEQIHSGARMGEAGEIGVVLDDDEVRLNGSRLDDHDELELELELNPSDGEESSDAGGTGHGRFGEEVEEEGEGEVDRGDVESDKSVELEDGWDRDTDQRDAGSGRGLFSEGEEEAEEGVVELFEEMEGESRRSRDDGEELAGEGLGEDVVGNEWEEHYDENGYPYLYNNLTGESKWKEDVQQDPVTLQEPEIQAAHPETETLEVANANFSQDLPEVEERRISSAQPSGDNGERTSTVHKAKTKEKIVQPLNIDDKLLTLPAVVAPRSRRGRTKPLRKGGKIRRKQATTQVISSEELFRDRALLANQETASKHLSPYASGSTANGQTYQRLHHKRRGQEKRIESCENHVDDDQEKKQSSSLEERLQCLFAELLSILDEKSQRVPRFKLFKLLVHSPWRLTGIRQHCQWMDTLCKPRTFLKTFEACGDEQSIGLEEFVQACTKPKQIVPPVMETLRTTIPVGTCSLKDRDAYIKLERFPYCRMERRIAFDEDINRRANETKKFASLHERLQREETRQETSRRAKWQIERKRKEARELRHRKKWLARLVSNKQRDVRTAAAEELRRRMANLSIGVTESPKAFATASPINPYSSVGVEKAIRKAPDAVQKSFGDWLSSKVATAEEEVENKLTKKRASFRIREARLDQEEKERRTEFDTQLQRKDEAFRAELKQRKSKIVQMRGDEKKIRQMEDDIFGELYKRRAAFLQVLKQHSLRPSLRRLRWIRTSRDANGEHHLVLDIASQTRLNLSVLPCKTVKHAQYLMTRCEQFHEVYAYGSVLKVQDWFFHVTDAFVEAYVLYEYTQAPTLANWIASADDIDESMALDISQNIAHIIREMHRIGLVHCGISPSAVRVIRGTQLKLELPILFKYEDVRTVADEAFMSPELRREGAAAIAKPVDVWAFGATIYSLLTKETLVAKAATVAASTYTRHRKVISRQKWARTLLKMTLKPTPSERATIDEVLALFYREGDDTRMRLEQASLGQ